MSSQRPRGSHVRWLHSRPADIEYADLMVEWARAVAAGVLELADTDPWRSDRLVVEAWVGADFRLYLRHHDDDERWGVCLGPLDVDPLTGIRMSPTARGTSASGSGHIASSLYHGSFATGPGTVRDPWTDPSGYAWWGYPPERGWAAGVEGERFLVVRAAPS